MNTDEFENEKEFDLYVKGAWDERKRIIKLLGTDEAFEAVYYGDGGADEALAYLIHIINREETA